MSYHIRVFAERSEPVLFDRLQRRLSSEGLSAVFTIGDETAGRYWRQVLVRHATGSDIAVLTRDRIVNRRDAKRVGALYLRLFESRQPLSAVRWLKRYLGNVSAVYDFEILDGVYEHNGWRIVGELQKEIWETAGGVMQADGEGFTNNSGYLILPAPPQISKGILHVAVLSRWRRWIPFELDLSVDSHIRSFLKGKVPGGVRKL